MTTTSKWYIDLLRKEKQRLAKQAEKNGVGTKFDEKWCWKSQVIPFEYEWCGDAHSITCVRWFCLQGNYIYSVPPYLIVRIVDSKSRNDNSINSVKRKGEIERGSNIFKKQRQNSNLNIWYHLAAVTPLPLMTAFYSMKQVDKLQITFYHQHQTLLRSRTQRTNPLWHLILICTYLTRSQL